ncbi:MAG TPA: ferrochelatase [Vicinamibacterales bacterium]|nr:ferrochelatase [Vicinamibacterales bacterium]
MTHDPGATDRSGSARVGVVLFSMGGPRSLDEVEPFLVELFSDRDLIELPLGAAAQPLWARLLAKVRGPSVRRNYRRIGGGSPQLRSTLAQARALADRLDRGPAAGRVAVTVAMRYTRPSAADALAELARRGVRRVVTLPLYPHFSRATTGSFHRAFERALAGSAPAGAPLEVEHITAYFDEPRYLDALADTVHRAVEECPARLRRDLVLLFSAHGLPQKCVDAGDPYVSQIETTRRGIVARSGLPHRHLLGYQSRTGPVRWTGPGTDELIVRLGREGVRALVIVPLSFVSDHIETLYEVDILFHELARRAGIEYVARSPALETHPLFIDALAHLVERRIAPRPRAADGDEKVRRAGAIGGTARGSPPGTVGPPLPTASAAGAAEDPPGRRRAERPAGPI